LPPSAPGDRVLVLTLFPRRRPRRRALGGGATHARGRRLEQPQRFGQPILNFRQPLPKPAAGSEAIGLAVGPNERPRGVLGCARGAARAHDRGKRI
jgi:hypothetical protein